MSGPGLVIIGAGQAGGRLAQALRREGYGEAIHLVGEEQDAPYERPPLSKGFLLGKVSRERLRLLDAQQWHALDVNLHCNMRVTAVDRTSRLVRMANGSGLPYDTLIFATGARARLFPGVVAAGTDVHYLRTIEDARRLQPWFAPGFHVTVIGAGFIGLELASSARQLGAAVSVIESAPGPLARLLPTTFAEWIARLHRDQGVELRVRCQVERLAPGMVYLETGEAIASDCIIVGIGAVPNDEVAAATGLVVRSGIIVDDAGRTSDPAIYAVGDVARQVNTSMGIDVRLESWRNAEDQAATVAAEICGKALPAKRPPWFWTDQYGRNIQLAGCPVDGLTLIERGHPDSGPYLAYFLAEGAVRGVIGIDCGRDVRVAQQLILSGQSVCAPNLPGPRVRASAN